RSDGALRGGIQPFDGRRDHSHHRHRHRHWPARAGARRSPLRSTHHAVRNRCRLRHHRLPAVSHDAQGHSRGPRPERWSRPQHSHGAGVGPDRAQGHHLCHRRDCEPGMRFTSDRRGVTLIELLVVIVIVSGVVATTYSLFQSQSQSFRKNTDRYDLAQNARGAIELTERVIRTMGAGVTGEQPVLVYGADDVLAFNADYVERDTGDMRGAACWNPDVPPEYTLAWKVANATTIPNSSPAYTYPPVD